MLLNFRKDDTEFRSGTSLGKITVPHPALQDPVAAELLYTAYSGWVSSGLKRWPIVRFSVTDSFGNSLSVCRRDLILESGQAVHLPLFPGKCHVPEEVSNLHMKLSFSLKIDILFH